MDQQKSTLRKEKKLIAGVQATLSWPSSSSPKPKLKGVAFLLPGAMISISEYNGLRDVIIQQDHLVVSLYMNVIWPIRNNHHKHAQDVKKVFAELKSYAHLDLPDAYTVIGHSAGGKVALLLASIIDPMSVVAVLALDPVDINPVEFTNTKGSNLPLDDGNSFDDMIYDVHEEVVHVNKEKVKEHLPIIMTCTDGGRGISTSHNANAIHKLHPGTTCYRHANAGHMAYCDNGGGLAGKLMPDVGTKEGNERARSDAHDLIKQILGAE